MENGNKQSLLKGAESQLELIPSDQMPDTIFAESESEETAPAVGREFTGARLFEKKRETYITIIALLAENVGMIKIGRLLHVSPNTVIAVRDREGEAVDIEKRRISSLARAGVRLCVEGIIEDLSDPERRKKISTRDKSIIAGVLAEKSELLSGGATSRVEHTAARATIDDFNTFLNDLQAVEGDSCLLDKDGKPMDQPAEAPEQKALPEAEQEEGEV